jgi:hypothetical protein
MINSNIKLIEYKELKQIEFIKLKQIEYKPYRKNKKIFKLNNEILSLIDYIEFNELI